MPRAEFRTGDNLDADPLQPVGSCLCFGLPMPGFVTRSELIRRKIFSFSNASSGVPADEWGFWAGFALLML